MKSLTENNLTEQPAIDWFKQLGYEYKFGPDISISGVLELKNNFVNWEDLGFKEVKVKSKKLIGK